MVISTPWREGACEECKHRTEDNECAAYPSNTEFHRCRTIKDCSNFRRKYAAVGLMKLNFYNHST